MTTEEKLERRLAHEEEQFRALRAENEKLLAQLAQARKDARRWQEVKRRATCGALHGTTIWPLRTWSVSLKITEEDTLLTAIDAALEDQDHDRR